VPLPFHPGPITLNIVDSAPSRETGQRTLTDWQIVRLTAALAPHPEQRIAIIATPGAEAQSFANQLRAVFLDCGWCVKGPLPAPKDQAAQDMQISLFAGYFGEETPPAAYRALKGAFDFLGLKVRSHFIADPNLLPHVFAIWVGAVSPPHLQPDIYPPLALAGPIGDTGFDSSAGPAGPVTIVGALPAASTIANLRQGYPEREILDDDPRVIIRRISENHTAEEAQALTESYVGKWMTLSFLLGDYQNHSTEQRLFPIAELTTTLGVFTYFYFETGWREALGTCQAFWYRELA